MGKPSRVFWILHFEEELEVPFPMILITEIFAFFSRFWLIVLSLLTPFLLFLPTRKGDLDTDSLNFPSCKYK